jgi:hypothetical protein
LSELNAQARQLEKKLVKKQTTQRAISGRPRGAGESGEVNSQQEILLGTSHFEIHRIRAHAPEDLRAVDVLPFESEHVGIAERTGGL